MSLSPFIFRTSTVSVLLSLEGGVGKWLAQDHTAIKWQISAWKQDFWLHTQALHALLRVSSSAPMLPLNPGDGKGYRKWEIDPPHKKCYVEVPCCIYSTQKKTNIPLYHPHAKCIAGSQTFHITYQWFPNMAIWQLEFFTEFYIYVYIHTNIHIHIFLSPSDDPLNLNFWRLDPGNVNF